MRPSFQANPDTVLLTTRLIKLHESEQLTYAQLNALAPGRVFNGKDRHILAAAIKRSMADEIYIGTVNGVGIKRLTSKERVDLLPSATEKTKRISKIALQKVASIDPDKLDEQSLKTYRTGITTHGVQILFGSKEGQKKIAASVEAKNGRLSIGDTISLFSPAK